MAGSREGEKCGTILSSPTMSIGEFEFSDCRAHKPSGSNARRDLGLLVGASSLTKCPLLLYVADEVSVRRFACNPAGMRDIDATIGR